jgi:hypothetical protein
MEHPLIGNLDNLTADELLDKISELNKKLNFATRAGNAYLCNQLRMAIESYQIKYREKTKKDSGKDFDNFIDIS